MPIPVTCQCGARFAAKDEMAGKRAKCPKCQAVLTVPAAAPPAEAPPANPAMASLLEEAGFAASKTGVRCPKCRADMKAGDVICVSCGYNTQTGKTLETKVQTKVERAAPAVAAPFAGAQANYRLAAGRVLIPSICIMVLGGLAILNILGNLVYVLLRRPDLNADPSMAIPFMVGTLLGSVIGIAINVKTILGANSMRELNSYQDARTAAIICLIPCCSPLVVLGIPFGIWALILLANPTVRASFRS